MIHNEKNSLKSIKNNPSQLFNNYGYNAAGIYLSSEKQMKNNENEKLMIFTFLKLDFVAKQGL